MRLPQDAITRCFTGGKNHRWESLSKGAYRDATQTSNAEPRMDCTQLCPQIRCSVLGVRCSMFPFSNSRCARRPDETPGPLVSVIQPPSTVGLHPIGTARFIA